MEDTEKEFILIEADEAKIRELEEGSAFTWEGMNVDEENLKAITDFFKENTKINLPINYYTWNGELFNSIYNLTGSNAYPQDLTFLSIALDNWTEMGNLPIIKLQVGARWLDDIVDNNRMREENLDLEECNNNTLVNETFNKFIECAKQKIEEAVEDDNKVINDRYTLRKYNERQYGVFDSEINDYVERGTLQEMQIALKKFRNGKQNLNGYSTITESKKLQESDNKITVHTGLSDDKAADILKSVIGQLSDGIWENSPAMEKYWHNLNVDTKGSDFTITFNLDPYYGGRYTSANPFKGKSEAELKKWFATKIKQIVKEEELKWDRNNTEVSSYLDRSAGVTVQDAYRVYDKLLGRKDYIPNPTKKTESKDMKYTVELEACGNIDHDEDPNNNVVNGDRVPKEFKKASSIEECQKIIRDYIEDYNLGGGNFIPAKVYEDGNYIGYISYNGRFWSNAKENKAKEIKKSITEAKSLKEFTNGFNFDAFANYMEGEIRKIYPSAKFNRNYSNGHYLEVYLANNDTSRFIIEAFINTNDDGSLDDGAIQVTYPNSSHYSSEDIDIICDKWTGNSNSADFNIDEIDKALEMIKFICDHYKKTDIESKIKNKKEESIREELDKEKEVKTEGTKQKRIARYNEFDNGHVFHSWKEMTNEEAEEQAKQASIEDPHDVYYVAYDDIMNPSSEIRWYKGKSYTCNEIIELRKKEKEALLNKTESKGENWDKEHDEYLKKMDKKYKTFCKNMELDEKDPDDALYALDELEGQFGDEEGEYQELREFIYNELLESKKIEESIEIKTESKLNTELEAAMDKLYSELESKLNNELDIKLEGKSFGRFNKQWKKAEIVVNNNTTIQIDLTYNLPDGIYNYIYIMYTARIITLEGSGKVAGFNYSSKSTAKNLAQGTYIAYQEESPDKIEQKDETIDSFIEIIKNKKDSKVIENILQEKLSSEYVPGESIVIDYVKDNNVGYHYETEYGEDGPFESEITNSTKFKDDEGYEWDLVKDFGYRIKTEDEDDLEGYEAVDTEEDKAIHYNEDGSEKTLLDYLQDRIGQQLDVGEVNIVLQSLFAQYNNTFISRSDLYNADLNESQELVVFDDEDMYTINYDIIDLDEGIIEITDVNME